MSVTVLENVKRREELDFLSGAYVVGLAWSS